MRTSAAFLAALLTLSASLHAQANPSAAEPATPDSTRPAITASHSDPAQEQSVSDVRIVRLSEIKGEAQLDRNTGRGFEPAFANLPIVQNAKLRTTAGVAEVEFEDNSSLRLTPDTVVEFPMLGRTSAGATLSTIHVLQGAVYISLTNNKPRSSAQASQFTVTFGAPGHTETLALNPSSHIELSVGTPTSKLAVFDGSVDVRRGTDTVTVAKKKELVFDPSDSTAPTLLTKVEKGPFDDWDKNQVDYHKRYANASAFGGSSSYGISDLNYYGSFADLPGCGNVWRPYFASAAWDPYSNGTWAYYPNAGYSWVSPYPWGWQPFHSGSWQQCGANGWGWQPGGQWVGLQNATRRPTSTTPIHPKPPLPPAPGHPTTVVVSTRPLSVSRLAAPDTFVFSKDSAGLGVPRQTFGKLGGVSNGVAHHGVMTTSVDSAPGLVRSGAAAVTGVGVAHPAANGPASRPATASSAGPSVIVSSHPTNSSASVSHMPSSPSGSPTNPSGSWSGTSHTSTSAPSTHAAPAPVSAPSAPGSSTTSHH